MAPTPVLEIQNLTKHYGGVKALTDAQFMPLSWATTARAKALLCD
jgi:ABC-type sugar transport system ATPase subunit